MRYQVKQKIFSIGESFTIKDENGTDIYKAKGQILSIGKKLRLFDMADNELCYIGQKLFKLLPEYDIYINGRHVANVKKKLAFFKNDFVIKSTEGEYYVEGDIFALEFNIVKDGVTAAYVSKQFFSFSDKYGVDIADDQDQIINLALVIVIDMACHDNDH